MKVTNSCWLCNHENITQLRQGVSEDDLKSSNFQITDDSYGETLSIYKCTDCNFLFCPTSIDLTELYQFMEDHDYEQTRHHRKLQAEDILKKVLKFESPKTLLDVGAGNGILVASAIESGLDAIGIEPSKWLCNQAIKHNIPMIEGSLDTLDKDKRRFDVITLIDVIEHVQDPIQMMQKANQLLNQDGSIVIATPDCSSFFSKLMGFKWWHYRIAHVGYFNKQTLNRLADEVDMKITHWFRPNWFLPVGYILHRMNQYLPFKLNLPKKIQNNTLKFNLFDSWLCILKKKSAHG